MQFTLLFFIILLGLFKFVDDTFEMCMFLVDISLCTRHNILRQAKLPNDRKGIAGPRYTHQKPIGRTQCIQIKFNRSVLNTWLCISIRLEHSIMRRCKNRNMTRSKMLNDAARKGRTLIRICTCPDLIQKDQIPRLRLFDNADNIPCMRRERRKTLLNALLIANVGIDITVDGKRRIRSCGKEAARLC